MFAVLIGLAYATLPVWAPTGWLAGKLERQLADALHRRVSVGRLSLSWLKGVQIEDIIIADLPDAPNMYLVRIQRLSCDFSPVHMLRTGQVERLEVYRPELWLVRGPDGRLNVDKLPARGRQRLPAYSLAVRDAICHIWTPRARQDFRMESAECQLDVQRALVSVNGSAKMPPEGDRRLGFNARLTVPKLRPDLDLLLGGSVRVEWADLALTDLPLSLVPELPVEQVGGTTSGSLSFQTRPDLSIDFDQRINLKGVKLMWSGLAKPAIVPDATLRCDGHWDFQTDHLRIKELVYETQAVALRSLAGRTIEIDPRGRTSLEAEAAGDIKDWQLLLREVPQLDCVMDSLGLDLAGQATFSVKVSRRDDKGRLAVTMDGRQSRWTVLRGPERVFEADAGLDKKLELTADGDFESRTVRPAVSLIVGDLSATAKAEGRLPIGGSGGGRAILEGWVVDAEVSTNQAEQVLSLFPPAKGISELAAWRGPLRAKAKLASESGGGQLDVELIADAAAKVGWGEWFEKWAGEPLAVRVIGDSREVDGRHERTITATMEHCSAKVRAALKQGDGAESAEQCSLQMHVGSLRDWLQTAPALDRRLRKCAPRGAADVQVNASRLGRRLQVEVSVDAGQAALTLPFERPGVKQIGVPAEMKLRFESGAGEAEAARVWELASGQARLGGISVTEISGQLALADGASGLWPTVESAHLDCRGAAACESQLDEMFPEFGRLRERLGLSGEVEWSVTAGGHEEAMHLVGRLDGRKLACSVSTGQLAVPTVRKSPGVPASLSVDLAVLHGRDGLHRRLDGRADLDLDGNHVTAQGGAAMEGWSTGRLSIDDADLLVGVALNLPDRMSAWLPAAGVEAIGGKASAEVSLERRGGVDRMTGGYVRLDKLGVGSNGSTLQLDGAASWDDADVRIPGLAWNWGQSGGRLASMVRLGPGGVQGLVNLSTDRLDIEDLQTQAAAFAKLLTPASGSDDAEARARCMLEYLSGCDLRVHGDVATLQSLLPPGIHVESSAVSYDLSAQRGPLGLTFGGTVDGGAVRGQVRTEAGAANPIMNLTYTAERIRPGPLVDAYLRRTFPGMTATGPLTLIDESVQKLFPAPGELNWPTGKGELIIDGGSLVGRAAPKIITRLFPGLNLARFDYSYMHSWFTKEITGRIRHQMIYKGRFYNMYMTGYSEPCGFRYEVGVDFLADFDSKYWAESGQGRIPLFTKTGKLQLDGSIDDEVVTYMPERFFDTVLVKNNPVFTAYHAVRKRVRAER